MDDLGVSYTSSMGGQDVSKKENTGLNTPGGGHATVTEVSRYLGLSRPTVYKLLDERSLPIVQIGRSRRIPRDAVHKFVEQHSVAAIA